MVEVKHMIKYTDEEEVPVYSAKKEPNETGHSSKADGRLEKIGSFERRYSEFLAVYSALMKSHRSLMEEFQGFPKKVLIGKDIFDLSLKMQMCF